MADQLQMLESVIFEKIRKSEEQIEGLLDSDVIYFFGEIRIDNAQYFRNFLEKVVERGRKSKKLSLCLSTPGGSVEAVEKMVAIIRHHYTEVNFIVPDMAMSAGTIFCMSGDKIYMDYFSSLGPIDPQVLDKEGRYFVPALGYLDKVKELIEKSRNRTITPAEFALLEKQDFAILSLYEQAKELSIELLKTWLVQYKFKDWSKHRTNNPGQEVTKWEKEELAEKIAGILSDNNRWHSHARMIGIDTLTEMKLEIENLSDNPDLLDAVRSYCDTLFSYLKRHAIPFHLHSRHL